LLAVVAGAGVLLGLVCGCSTNLENLEPTTVLECGRLSAQNEEGTLCQSLVAPNIKSQDVEFASLATVGGQTALKGTLTLPDWGAAPNLGKKLPGIVLVAGEGPMSRDGMLAEDATGAYNAPVAVLQDVAEGMSRRGYAVLRYDKRTCTPDINPMCTSAPEIATAAAWGDLVGDAAAAAKFMATVPDVDSQDIILMGFSQGATVVLDAASQVEGLSEVVLLAGVFDPIDLVMARRIQWRLEAFADTATKEEIDALQKKLSLVESGFMAIKEGYMPAEELFFGSTPTFWKDWIAATTMTGQNLQTLNRPLFYLRGASDQNASEADQAGFTAAMAGLKAHKVIHLSDHNHALVRAGEDGQVSEECTRILAEWLGRPPTAGPPTIERLD